ncbi:MAG: hypothetical protein AAF658_06475, partial [Myxococcota bacterium]
MRRNRRSAFPVAILLLNGFSSCTLPAIDDTSSIACATDGECPSDLRCASFGRCVPRDREDVIAPGVAAATVIAPETGTDRTRFSLTLTFDEALGEAPEVFFVVEDAERVLQLETPCCTDEQRSFEFAFTADQTRDPEGLYPLFVRSTDRAGNQSDAALGQNLTLDYTAPALRPEFTSLLTLPSPLNPRTTPTAFSPATSVSLVLVTDEVVRTSAELPDVESLLQTRDNADALVPIFIEVEGNGLVFSFEADWDGVAGAAADGEYRLEIVLEDLAGNRTIVPVPCPASDGVPDGCSTDPTQLRLMVDQTPPAPPDSSLIELLRNRWGTADTGGLPSNAALGTAGATEPRSALLLFESPEIFVIDDAECAARLRLNPALASGESDGDGAFGTEPELTLPESRSGEVFIAAVDGAGNVSDADGDPCNGAQATQMEAVRWSATLLGKQQFDTAANPHELETTAWLSDFVRRGSRTRSGHLLSTLTSGSVGTDGGAAWEFLSPSRERGSLAYAAGVYQPTLGALVVAGIERNPGGPSFSRTFTYDGRHYESLVVSDPEGDGIGPTADGFSLAYDPRRDVVVAFGGGNGRAETLVDEIWEFDGQTWSRRWPREDVATAGPSPRKGHAWVYDPREGAILAFGGCTDFQFDGFCAATAGDLWKWDGTWTELCTSDTCQAEAPGSRRGAAFAWDPLSAGMLLFGGDIDGGAETGDYLDDQWLWRDGRWSPQCTEDPCASTRPGPRTVASLSFDPVRARAFLSGGCFLREGFAFIDSFGCLEVEAPYWEWDGTRWFEITTADGVQT